MQGQISCDFQARLEMKPNLPIFLKFKLSQPKMKQSEWFKTSKSNIKTMKGLRATESHSADRAAQTKQKVIQTAKLENYRKTRLLNFYQLKSLSSFSINGFLYLFFSRPGRPSGFPWHGAPS